MATERTKKRFTLEFSTAYRFSFVMRVFILKRKTTAERDKLLRGRPGRAATGGRATAAGRTSPPSIRAQKTDITYAHGGGYVCESPRRGGEVPRRGRLSHGRRRRLGLVFSDQQDETEA